MGTPTNEEDMEEFLTEAIYEYVNGFDEEKLRCDIKTFNDVGSPTNDKGLIMTLRSRDEKVEYQLTIVRSK